MRAYVAGPMRGFPQFNFPAFDSAAAHGRGLDWEVISPAEIDRESDPNIEKLSVEEVSTHEACRMFARRDLDILLSLRGEDGDAIALLPGWEKSTGAMAEFFVARWLGLRILDATTWQPFSDEAIVHGVDFNGMRRQFIETLLQERAS